MKAKELRGQSLEELKERIDQVRRELFDARMKNYTSRLDDTSLLRKHRREVARLSTLISEKSREQAVGGAK